MTDHVQIFIFSKGRIGKQKTLKYLPQNTIKEQVTFVTPKSEIREHKAQDYGKGLDYMAAPENIHLADKRRWVVENYLKSGGRYFMMADDDLGLSIHNKETGKFVSLRKYDNTKRVESYFNRHLPKLFTKHKMIGLASKFMADAYVKKNGFYKENTKCCCFFGYDGEELLNTVPYEATKTMWSLDTTWNLFMLQAGHSAVSDYHMLWDAVFETAKSPGGANLYRNKETSYHAMLRTMLLFPGLISRGRDGLHHSSFLRIDWRHATSDISLLKDKGRELFKAELEFQKTDVKTFLSALPSESKSYYRELARNLLKP